MVVSGMCSQIIQICLNQTHVLAVDSAIGTAVNSPVGMNDQYANTNEA